MEGSQRVWFHLHAWVFVEQAQFVMEKKKKKKLGGSRIGIARDAGGWKTIY